MSTRIYIARRFRVGHLNEFVTLVRERMTKAAMDTVIRAMFTDVDVKKVEEKVDQRIRDNSSLGTPDTRERLTHYYRFEEAMELCRKASNEPYRHEHSIDGGWNLWYHAGYFYAIPYGSDQLLERIKFPKWAEDYSYHNGSDEQLKHMTVRQWHARRDLWDKICLNGNWNTARLSVNAVDLSPTCFRSTFHEFRRVIHPYPDELKKVKE